MRALGRALGRALQVEKLRAELQAASVALKENRTSQLETRLNTLADSLVEKQGLIDQLISEKVGDVAIASCCERRGELECLVFVSLALRPHFTNAWTTSGSGGVLLRRH